MWFKEEKVTPLALVGFSQNVLKRKAGGVNFESSK